MQQLGIIAAHSTPTPSRGSKSRTITLLLTYYAASPSHTGASKISEMPINHMRRLNSTPKPQAQYQ